MKKIILMMMVGLQAAVFAQTAGAMKPYGKLPSRQQLKWFEQEIIALIHFGPNTFMDKEWGFGDADPKVFNPEKFDAAQIVGAMKAGGIRQFMLVAKHHDGFCLWPTKTTPYNITASPFRNGKGDMVREFADAARAAGLRFGVYCSPWDRNAAVYGTEKYLPMYQAQLTELLTNYGKICEMWFDGANGGDGYYGGAREKRSIGDADKYYDFPNTLALVRRLQPDVVIFGGMDGTDCRWIGNECGYAAADCWATYSPKELAGEVDPRASTMSDFEVLNQGVGGGVYFMPAECDFPLRDGWFWHADEDATVRSPEKLLDIYFRSVGRGQVMNIGIAPNMDGLVCEVDRTALAGFKALLDKTFAKNLAAGATAKANVTRDGFSASAMLDDDRYSCWAAPDGVKTAVLEFTLPEAREVGVALFRENIKLGQRVNGWTLEVKEESKHAWWREVTRGETIGACRLERFQPVKAVAFRLKITSSLAEPTISDFKLF